MVNFLSKFLSKETNEPVTDSVVEADVLPEPASVEPVAPEPEETAVPIAAAAAERPMHHVDPHSGMPDHMAPPMGEMEEFESIVGEKVLPGTELADEDSVIDALRTVYDPEIPVNIYDLGLIYTVNHEKDGDINIDMSLTAPGCPVAGEMPGMVSNAVAEVDGVGVVTTRIVWDPAWTMERMSEDAKLALGMF